MLARMGSVLPSLREPLALELRLDFLRDRAWWALAAAGLAVAAGLALLVPGALWASRLVGPGQWFWAVVTQPVLEELTFRGLLQGELANRRWGRRARCGVSLANFGASLAFTALHFHYHPPLWAASVMAPSLALGWLRERNGTTWSPMLMHALFNLAFFACAALVAP